MFSKVLAVMVCAASLAGAAQLKVENKGSVLPFAIYTDFMAKGNHGIPSGWMGDYSDIKMLQNWQSNPHSGKTCIKFVLNDKRSQGAGWAGIYWQAQANNWGTMNKSFNLAGAKKLTFWARGETGKERIAEFKVGGITGEYSDSDSNMIPDTDLTTEWVKYTIPLDGLDLSKINGLFCWSVSLDANPQGVTFYLDDVVFE